MIKLVKETAKEIRSFLKNQWPGTKFSVRSKRFAGGSAVDIAWTDGPTEREIKEITRRFTTDYASRYVGTQRSVSRPVMEAAAWAVARCNGVPMPAILGEEYFHVDPRSEIDDVTHRLVWATGVYEADLETVFVEALEKDTTGRYWITG